MASRELCRGIIIFVLQKVVVGVILFVQVAALLWLFGNEKTTVLLNFGDARGIAASIPVTYRSGRSVKKQ